MNLKKQRIHKGRVVQGHRIASGMSPTGKNGLNATVVKQKPFFIEAGIPGMETFFAGTVNVNLLGHTFTITNPEYTVTCEWYPAVSETFWFVSAALEHNGIRYSGYVYFPLPGEFQERNEEVMELLMPSIPELDYGQEVNIFFSEERMSVYTLKKK